MNMMLDSEVSSYRKTTHESHTKMPGITLPSFRCVKCKQTKVASGRKQVIKGSPKFGYYCAECAAKVNTNANP